MGNILYILGIALIVIWEIGFYALNANGFIHLLLAAAIALIIIRISRQNRIIK